MPKSDKINKQKIEDFVKNYIQKTHVGTLESYNLEKIMKCEWFDKASDEIFVKYKVRVQTKAPTIGPPPISFYEDTIIVTGYYSARTYNINHQGHLNNSYPEWMS